jgi:hypothetical protein
MSRPSCKEDGEEYQFVVTNELTLARIFMPAGSQIMSRVLLVIYSMAVDTCSSCGNESILFACLLVLPHIQSSGMAHQGSKEK